MIATSTLQSPNSWRRTSPSRGGRCESCRKMLFERSSNNWFFFLTLLLFFSCSKPTMPSPWAVKWNFWPWIAATDHRGRKAKATTRTSNRKPRRYNLITHTCTFLCSKCYAKAAFLTILCILLQFFFSFWKTQRRLLQISCWPRNEFYGRSFLQRDVSNYRKVNSILGLWQLLLYLIISSP